MARQQTRSEIHGSRRSRKNKSKKKGKVSKWRLVLGSLLIILALALFAVNPIKDYLIGQRTQVNTVGNLSREQIEANQNRDVSFNFADVSTIDAFDVISDGVNPNDLPVIGGIAMPELKMNLPIYKGTSNEGMYYGAGTLSPDQVMGQSNYALASHHSKHHDLLFAPLLNAKEGQTIYLTDLDKVYEYKVDSVFVVDPSAMDVLNPSDQAKVTLITCTSDLANRLIVQGTLQKTVDIQEADQDMIEAFELPQTTAA